MAEKSTETSKDKQQKKQRENNGQSLNSSQGLTNWCPKSVAGKLIANNHHHKNHPMVARHGLVKLQQNNGPKGLPPASVVRWSATRRGLNKVASVKEVDYFCSYEHLAMYTYTVDKEYGTAAMFKCLSKPMQWD